MKLLSKILRYGILRSFKIFIHKLKLKTGFYKFRYDNNLVYKSPTKSELIQIESDLKNNGIIIHNLSVCENDFSDFISAKWFPEDYHGGISGGVWFEKILEHFISYKLLDIENYSKDDIFVDIAAASSPWTEQLRKRIGIKSYAIDLNEVGESYAHYQYYRVEDATKSSFSDSSVKGAALHCAYEMFSGDDDINLIAEASRILTPGGKLIILPLYMHTHFCGYSTPEYFMKGFNDKLAKEYVRYDVHGVAWSRKYDHVHFLTRVIKNIKKNNMKYRLLKLTNKTDLSNEIYCHFILEIEK